MRFAAPPLPHAALAICFAISPRHVISPPLRYPPYPVLGLTFNSIFVRHCHPPIHMRIHALIPSPHRTHVRSPATNPGGGSCSDVFHF
jgi:hypothetical protein